MARSEERKQRRDPTPAAAAPLDYAVSLAGLSRGNEVELLPGGDEAFPAMLRAINSAEREVLLETYIVSPDVTGRCFFDALLRAVARGCDVRFIADAVGSWSIPSEWWDELERAGVKVMVYRPVAPWRRRWGFWRRDHRKILVVDNDLGFVGGCNLADEYDARTPAGAAWRDLHLRVSGPAAVALAQLFASLWNREQPPSPPEGLMPRRVVTAERAGGIPVAVVGNRETRHRSLIRRSFLFAARRARTSILIANPYFIPDRSVIHALINAARRGADVRVVVPNRSDVRTIDLASRSALPRLLRAGIRVAEWPGMMHAKAASIDGMWATVGSYNFDRRSLRFNLEVTANVFDDQFARSVEQRLRADFSAAAELTLEALAARPLFLRILSALAYQLRSLL